MKIRPVYTFELPGLVDGARLYTIEGKVAGGFVPEKFVTSWTDLMSWNNRWPGAIVLGAFGQDGKINGAIGGLLSEPLQNHHLTAVEAFWYVIPEYRSTGLGRGIAVRLFRAFERRATELGAKTIISSNRLCLQPAELDSIYRRMGYRPLETYYAKDL